MKLNIKQLQTAFKGKLRPCSGAYIPNNFSLTSVGIGSAGYIKIYESGILKGMLQ